MGDKPKYFLVQKKNIFNITLITVIHKIFFLFTCNFLIFDLFTMHKKHKR